MTLVAAGDRWGCQDDGFGELADHDGGTRQSPQPASAGAPPDKAANGDRHDQRNRPGQAGAPDPGLGAASDRRRDTEGAAQDALSSGDDLPDHVAGGETQGDRAPGEGIHQGKVRRLDRERDAWPTRPAVKKRLSSSLAAR
jgi:hypothetical protein